MDSKEWFVYDAGGSGYELRYGTEAESERTLQVFNRRESSVSLLLRIAALLNAAEYEPESYPDD